MRSFYSNYFPPAVKWLIIVNTAIFLLQQFAGGVFGIDLAYRFGLVPLLVFHKGWIWQAFTYMFLHGGIWHLVINMLMLWMFGIDLERDWGTRRFLKYYFLCGVGAAICVLGMALVQPAGMLFTTIGASGAIFGLLLAFGVVYSDRIILMMLIFPMKAKYAVMIFGAIELYYFWQPSRGVSNVAHLGGMLFGYLYLKARLKPANPVAYVQDRWQAWRMERARRRFQVYMRKHRSDRDRWIN
jgi:membrane associated rhomboid family serine protease